MFKDQRGAILFEVALLTIIVLLVDETLVRAGMAFVPAMLLAQRALKAAASAGSNGHGDRRLDVPARNYIEELLSHFREFYATCHLMGSGKLSSDEALERTNGLEKSLNQLLAEVTAATKERAGLGAPSGA